MKDITSELRSIVNDFTARIQQIPDSEFEVKPVPAKWSKKEVPGHL